MEVVLLGTGSADGWPNPFCTCASCESQRRAGEIRGQTAALVDGTLLLDCGPETPRAAERAGRSLAGVRTLLVLHGHPDHVCGSALLWRTWAQRLERLTVAGPPGALAGCRPWIGPDAPVRFVEVAPGDRLDLDGHVVRVLAAAHDDGAVLYDVTSADGARLMYATDTGPLPEPTLDAVAGASYDLVLLEETFGDVSLDEKHPACGQHLDLMTFPAQLRALRERGAIVDRTEIVAVHLGHHNPPAPELSRRLAPWGARITADGTALRTVAGGSSTEPVPSAPRRVLVIGGARSGKSAEAERRLAAASDVTYVATGGRRENDPGWNKRVAAHRARRPPSWRTVETTDIVKVLLDAPGPVLVDCLTLWLAAVLDECGAWSGAAGTDPNVDSVVDRLIAELAAAWRTTTVPVVAVTNEVGSGVVPATDSGIRFRDALGRLNQRIAAESDEVVLLVAGQVLTLRSAVR
jgi:adenosylcobinamide kinase/adenosylcobinamide-phosphate guanylyltransferase